MRNVVWSIVSVRVSPAKSAQPFVVFVCCRKMIEAAEEAEEQSKEDDKEDLQPNQDDKQKELEGNDDKQAAKPRSRKKARQVKIKFTNLVVVVGVLVSWTFSAFQENADW